TFNAAGATEKLFNLRSHTGNKSYIEIQNAAPGTQLFDITEPDQPVPIGEPGSGLLKRVVDNTFSSRKILATSVYLTPSVKPVNFRNIDAASGEYVIISHKALMKPAGSYPNAVKAYAAYRASEAGGSYDTL